MKSQISCIVLLLALPAIMVGCNAHTPQGFPAPPIMHMSPTEQGQAEQNILKYVTALQSHNYEGAAAIMSPKFQAKMPLARLKMQLRGHYRPLIGAHPLTFDTAQPLGTRQVVLRAHFVGADGNLYHTNFILSKTGSMWRIDDLIPPATHPKPVLSKKHTVSV